ncbi:MAG: TIGR01459 family HAD-type hydrolase [Roseovarius sp.]|nr:TIGR01459 family HAD-type hydrolase [Roseovarius sp.]
MLNISLEALSAMFGNFLIDQFGVLLDGTKAYPDAAQALMELSNRGKRIVILSNSGKRSVPNELRLEQMGFDRDHFDSVVTSGEVARTLLAKRVGHDIPAGGKVFVISRDEDLSCIEGLDLSASGKPEESDLILISGSRGDEIALDSYETLLAGAARNGVPALCCNPDMTMLSRHGSAFGAGRIAGLYCKLGGNVEMIGKPYPQIYNAALDRLGHPDLGDVVCIGDSPMHDIRGAHGAGISAVLVLTGLSSGINPGKENPVLEKSDFPDYVMKKFQF